MRYVSDVAMEVSETLGRRQIIIVVEAADGEPEEVVCFYGNLAGMANLLEAATGSITHNIPRPDKCKVCGPAWDAILEAHIQLTEGRKLFTAEEHSH